MRNSVAHSGCGRIEVSVDFDDAELRERVEEEGKASIRTAVRAYGTTRPRGWRTCLGGGPQVNEGAGGSTRWEGHWTSPRNLDGPARWKYASCWLIDRCSPNLAEGEFCELPLYGVLRTSAVIQKQGRREGSFASPDFWALRLGVYF